MNHFEFLRVERRDEVLRVTIDRPAQRNPLSTEVLAELRRAFTDAANDETLRAAVVTGAGDRSFAAGGDLKEFDRLRSAADAERLWTQANEALHAVAADGESLEQCVERFLQPMRAQAPQVLRAFKTIALGERLALSKDERERRERAAMIDTWVHPDHWLASERFLARRRPDESDTRRNPR